MKLIYMSEELKKRGMNVSRAVIIQSGERLTYTGPIRLVRDGKTVAWLHVDPEGLKAAPEHHVRAWIETDCEVEHG